MSKNAKKTLLTVIWLGLLIVLAVGIKFINFGPSPSSPVPNIPPKELLSKNWAKILAHAAGPVRGKANAPFTLVEFGDFECPLCGKARPKLERLLQQAPDQVNMIFVHRPFAFHKRAVPAAAASEAAAAQGKFWPMYDTLYSHQDDLEPYYYSQYAAAIGLAPGPFNKAVQSGQYEAKVRESARFADSLRIISTPTVLIRNNKTGEILIYDNKDGLNRLAANPPWGAAAKTAQAAR